MPENDAYLPPGRRAFAGAVSGLAAGLVMALVALFQNLATGQGLSFPAKAVAGAVFGVEAAEGGAGVVIVGILIHFAVAALLGAFFGVLVRLGTSVSTATLAGAAYGITVWFVSSVAVLPLVNKLMLSWASINNGWWLLEHLVYGVTLGLVPAVQERMAIMEDMASIGSDHIERAA